MRKRLELARFLLQMNKKGTQMRHARGVVVSSTIGTSVVTIDGGSTNITAYNYSHTASPPAGTVVDLLLVGKMAYILGAYVDTSWTAISSFTNSWVNFGSGFFSAAYRVHGDRGELRGIIKSGTINTSAFTLPIHPLSNVLLSTVSQNAFGVIQIGSSGSVTPTIGSNASVSLDGVSFPLT